MENKLTIDQVSDFLENEQEGKLYLQKIIDKSVTKGIQTYTENHPVQDDPKKKEDYEELNQKLLKRENMVQLKEDGIEYAINKNLSPKIGSMVATKNQETTEANIDSIYDEIQANVQKARNEIMSNSHVPKSGDVMPKLNNKKSLIKYAKDIGDNWNESNRKIIEKANKQLAEGK